ncbi:MAG: DNA-binding response regulator [Alphaproteobacteria bacterium CG1_02_46_17]|nr:MAG: DNA-binding response regulator [Alphaproteobacteria bacterium CG1_02_46_17]
MKILLVEDNARLSELIKEALVHDGFVVDHAPSFANAHDMIQHFQYNLVLLDLTLPDGDGLDIIKYLTKNKSPPPILVMTARAGLDDRIKGLNLGADDYLVKPFATEELIARCRALLRRPGNVLGTILTIGNIELNSATRDVFINTKRANIPPKELALLEHLMRHAGQIVSREHLEASLYTSQKDVSPNALEATISRLRKWLKSNNCTPTLHTSHGIGYVLIPE